MDDNSENSKRIAKNTILLYVRMIFTMVVSLFTSRVILSTLGIEDYGVFNVVAGFVTMFSVFTSSLSAAISRFLTYELGKGDLATLKKIFSTSVNVQLILSVVVIIIAEVIGVWFLNSKLNIPEDRMVAANWAYQCALANFLFSLISVPYNSSIIAHERMDVYAFFSIFEVIFKLVIVYMIFISPFDKLITYSLLYAFVGLSLRIIYGVYCKRHFEECTYQMVIDKPMLKEISSFAGWNMLGSGAYVFNTQGVNILSNLFFGVTVNAARGIATQVESVIRQFVTNFTTALNPQITKSYAVGDLQYMYKLVCKGAKYSYFMMLFFVVPFLFESDIILSLWLKEVPVSTALFLRLTMIGTLFDILGNSTANACWATGKVKRYYLYVSTIGFMVFFISWGLFALGFPAYVSYMVFIVVYCILIFVKLFIIKGLINFPVRMYMKETIGRIIPVSLLVMVISSIPCITIDSSILRLVITFITSSLSFILATFFIGLEASEKNMVKRRVHFYIHKIQK